MDWLSDFLASRNLLFSFVKALKTDFSESYCCLQPCKGGLLGQWRLEAVQGSGRPGSGLLSEGSVAEAPGSSFHSVQSWRGRTAEGTVRVRGLSVRFTRALEDAVTSGVTGVGSTGQVEGVHRAHLPPRPALLRMLLKSIAELHLDATINILLSCYLSIQ